MSRFVQLHVLTHYPPSNLNRDDTGRPKTALVGDALRLRISSQSQKRAWRTSDVFETALAGHIGTRTKELGPELYKAMTAAGAPDKDARAWARAIAEKFGKLKAEKKEKADKADKAEKGADKADVAYTDLQIEQLAHISPQEWEAAMTLARACAERKSAPQADELSLLTQPRSAVDIAMFGRMLADAPQFNVEAAIQVSHAFTVHKAQVEDDFFSAVDDINPRGAGHIDERGYGAGLYYLYVCIDRELLKTNLGGDEALAAKGLAALVEAITKVSPTGMQNSFASRAYAGYVLAEKGAQQPRSLSQAFVDPVRPGAGGDDDGSGGGTGMVAAAKRALKKRQDGFDRVYGACADARYELDVEAPQGSLSELIAFVQG
ncbi:MAG: type I-E CRISPR-associated protein Cas7/Cse4/CasC [Burkholderiales bacterium]|nr:type I-E CRISPR-associated protein Cas7/Cse4/CasC [Burkholderiales bacterium]